MPPVGTSKLALAEQMKWMVCRTSRFIHDHCHTCLRGSLRLLVLCQLLQFRRNDEQEASSSHPGGPPGTTIGGGGNVRSRFRLREPNQRRDQNQIASAIQASMDSANAEAAHRDARQQALAQVYTPPLPPPPAPPMCMTSLCAGPCIQCHTQHRQDSKMKW